MCIVDGHLHVVERSIAVCPQTMSRSNVTVQKKNQLWSLWFGRVSPFKEKSDRIFLIPNWIILKRLKPPLASKLECGSYIAIARIFVNKSPTFFLGDVGRVTQPGFSHCKTGCCSFFGNTCEYHWYQHEYYTTLRSFRTGVTCRITYVYAKMRQLTLYLVFRKHERAM